MDRALFEELIGERGIKIDAERMEKFNAYSEMLIRANEVMNLTAITSDKGISSKHFADSLLVMPLLPCGSFSLIDVGTGAGFPGIPLAIMRGDMRLALLDSLNKRIGFLKEVCEALDIKAELIHARAEDVGRDVKYRESFDVVTARAVARLPTLCEYCMPLVKVGGSFIAMKGPEASAELIDAESAILTLGGHASESRSEELGDGEGGTLRRCLIKIDKKLATPKKYPRSPSKIKEIPLHSV